MAFQANAFQNNAFQVIGATEVTGLYFDKPKRKRYSINDQWMLLTDDELRQALEAMVARRQEPSAPVKPKKKAKRRSEPKEIQFYPDIEAVYQQMAHVDRTARILRQIAIERMLEEEDEIALLLGAM